MNRNVESHFAENPTSLDISRSMFDRSSSVKFTANVGELIPFYVDEVLPGDTFQIETSKVVRLQTMLKPIMDNMYLDTYFFYVKNIDIWDHAPQFFGESNKAWTPNVEYRVPRLAITTHPGVGSLADYMGIPLNIELYGPAEGYPQGGINALPFRAYAKICDDWFKSEVVTDPLVIPTGDSTAAMGSKSDSDIYCANGGTVFHACKYHDYFTSCLPAPQCGPSVKIPSAGFIFDGKNTAYGRAPVSTGAVHLDPSWTVKNLIWQNNANASKYDTGSSTIEGESVVELKSSGYEGRTFYPVNLYADIGSALGTINDLRIAFQVQKFYEKLARGRRYVEVLKSQFGVTAPDLQLGRSEYLGGNRIPLSVHEVTNNSQGENSFLGDLGAMSRTVDVHDDFVKSFTQHGWVIGVCVVRYDHTYGQGIERFWSRSSMFDYYWPVFANIGEQAVLKKEINFVTDTWNSYDDVFGYQEAWADYRYKPSRVAGEFRVDAANTLASWHLADSYPQTFESRDDYGPFLSDGWMREDPSNVDRCLAVTSAVSNQYFVDIFIKNICTRVMPMYSIPGLADHH